MPMNSPRNAWILSARPMQLAALLLAMTILTGCLLGTTATVTDSGCIIFEPIFYSSEGDTPETIAALKSHNAAWHSTCGDSE